MKFRNFFIRLPILLLGLVGFPLVAIFISFYLNLPTINMLKPLGLLLVISGLVIFTHCTHLHFSLGQTSPDPLSKHTKLINKGFYRYSRNPMYLGYFAIIMGEFFIFGQVLLLVYLLGFITFFQFFMVPKEEAKLMKNMGKDFVEYCQKTPRWLFGKASDRKK